VTAHTESSLTEKRRKNIELTIKFFNQKKINSGGINFHKQIEPAMVAA
jgi:hypothetical protein